MGLEVNEEDQEIAVQLFEFAKHHSKTKKKLLINQEKTNRLAERENLKDSTPFRSDSKGQIALNPRNLANSLDEELYEKLEPESIDFIMQEFNEGIYDPHLLQGF
jgi:hypothetical protein